jgi:hypothetical protein
MKIKCTIGIDGDVPASELLNAKPSLRLLQSIRSFHPDRGTAKPKKSPWEITQGAHCVAKLPKTGHFWADSVCVKSSTAVWPAPTATVRS